jgi:hypothetical protein
VAARPGAGRTGRPDPAEAGPQATPVDARDRKITELERRLAEMTGRAERAEVLVEAQKKLAALLGRPGMSAQP